MDKPTSMGESMWERQEPIKGYVSCFTFPQVVAVHFSFFSFHSLLASSSLLLAPLWLWSVPQLQVSQSLYYLYLTYLCMPVKIGFFN